jgi:hypothetical protein
MLVDVLTEFPFIVQDAKIKASWEEDIMAMTSDIFTEAFLGTRVDPANMYEMLKGTWTKSR